MRGVTTADFVTLDAITTRAEHYNDRAARVDRRRAVLTVLLLLPVLLGKLAGWSVRGALFAVAATVEGYRSTRYPTARVDTTRAG